MRRLLAALLLAPAIAAAQVRPALLIATREWYIAPDSARASWWGQMLRDRNGTLFFDRLTDPDNFLATVVVEALPNGQVRNTGPAGAAVNGTVLGWIRVQGHDSLWVLADPEHAILVPGHAPVKLGDRWITELGTFGDSLIVGIPSGLLADGSTLWVPFHFDSVRRQATRSSLPSLYVRADPGARAPRVVAAIPPGLNCVRHDREGNATDAPPACSNFRFDLSPSGARIAEAFRTPDQVGLTVLSLTATGDPIFRSEFALTPAILPDSAFADVARRVDTTLSAAVRALWIAEQRPDQLGGIIAGDDGTIWVELEAAERIPHRWIEIDAHGVLVGAVVMPPNTMLRGGLRDRGWGAVQDAAGAQAGVVMHKVRNG